MEGQELTAASVGGASAELSRLWSSIRVRSRGVPPERSRSARWRLLTTRLGSAIQLVGDGIFVTDPAIIRRAIGERVATAALIKLNQIGTCRRRSRPSPQRAQAATARSSATGPARRPTTSLPISPWRRRRPDQDRHTLPRRARREVQPAAPHRRGAWHGGHARGPEPFQAMLNHHASGRRAGSASPSGRPRCRASPRPPARGAPETAASGASRCSECMRGTTGESSVSVDLLASWASRTRGATRRPSVFRP